MAASTPVITPWNDAGRGIREGVKERQARSSATHSPGSV
jgi:hypothetical protein